MCGAGSPSRGWRLGDRPWPGRPKAELVLTEVERVSWNGGPAGPPRRRCLATPLKRRDLRFVDPVVGPASLSSAERRARSRGQGWAHGLNLHFQSCGACTMPLPTSAGLNPGFKLAVIAEPTSRSVNRCCEK